MTNGVPAKPILLLDVDGVLCVPRKRPTKRPIRLEWAPGRMISFWPTPRTKRFMQMAWDLFDVRWLTAWGKGANMIATYYGLNERQAIKYGDSKAASARSALRDSRSRVAWIEDGIDDPAKEIVSEMGWSYFHCEPFVGVTGEHMKALRAFAGERRPSHA